MMTVTIILAIASLIAGIASAAGYCPLWVAVLLLCVLELVDHLPK